MAGEVTGGTFNEKWIDGGTAATNPTFNVDDPTMWTPMSVISGLASGFCERADLILPNKGFNAEGAATAVAANIANGTVPNNSMTNMLTAATVPFSPPSVAGSNYMKTVDTLLTNLISVGGATGYVKPDNSAYADYDDLATCAQLRATDANSACGNIQSDGTDFCVSGYITYPANWAKQRKWMLDELRLTYGSGTTTPRAVVSSAGCYRMRGTDDAYSSSVASTSTAIVAGMSSLYDKVMSKGHTPGATFDSAIQAFRTENMLFAMEVKKEGTTTKPFMLITSDSLHGGVGKFYNRPPANILVSGTDVSEGDEISLYGGISLNNEAQGEINECLLSRVSTVIVQGATSTPGYVILPGGTVSISTGKSADVVTVSSGGSLNIYEGAHISTLNIVTGATVSFSGITNNKKIIHPIKSTFVDYTKVYLSPTNNVATYKYIKNNSTYTITDDSDYIIDGATVTITGPTTGYVDINVYLYNKAKLTLSGNIRYTGAIGSGCSLTQYTNDSAYIYDGQVLPGGHLYVSGNTASTDINSGILGCVVYPNALVDINYASIDDLLVGEGATVNITGNTATTSVANCTFVRFNNFGLNIQPGWNTYTVGDDAAATHILTSTSVLVTGSTVPAVASNTLTSPAVANSIADLPSTADFSGTYKMIGGTTASIVAIFNSALARGQAHLWNSLSVVGIGGGTVTIVPGTASEHYETFSCRQFEHDPDPPTI